MKKSVLLFLAAAFMIFALTLTFTLSGCTSKETVSASQTAEAKGEYHKVTAEEAREMMKDGNVTVVDVRRPDEFAEGHIADAVLVTNETIGNTMPEELPDKDAVLLVYCRSGRRSREASNKLLDLGYRNVYDFGGITDWPYEVVKD